ncbi:MAG TPA: redoxin domain-containing protein [Cyclobacteriaceae bacterium]|nr:redoxin domain-containing protein [Cyclobacteriaceae bacterium]
MKNYTIVLLLTLTSLPVLSQVANFTAINVGTGKSISLSDFKSSPGVVVIFTSSGADCPYDQYYLSRLQKIARDFESKLPVLFVNPHLADSEDAMKSSASKFGEYYLSDKEQAVMQALKATKSPETFVLKNSGGNFSIFYHGAIDDNAQVASDVHENYLADAISALLAGQTPKSKEVRPVGCIIRRK